MAHQSLKTMAPSHEHTKTQSADPLPSSPTLRSDCTLMGTRKWRRWIRSAPCASAISWLCWVWLVVCLHLWGLLLPWLWSIRLWASMWVNWLRICSLSASTITRVWRWSQALRKLKRLLLPIAKSNTKVLKSI